MGKVRAGRPANLLSILTLRNKLIVVLSKDRLIKAQSPSRTFKEALARIGIAHCSVLVVH